MASVSGPTNPNGINWGALTQQQLVTTAETPLGAGEFVPGGQHTAAGLPVPRQFDLEGMLAELRSKLDGETFRSKIEEVKAQIQASRALQLGGLFGAMNDQWMATGANLETQAEYRQNGVSWWDKQRAVHALDQAGLSHWEASQLVDTAEAAMRGDTDAQARLSQLVSTLRDSIGLDRFASAMKNLGQMMGSQWGWPLGGKTDDSMNTMLRGLMNTLAAAGSQAFGSIGGAIVADTLLPALADRYAENAYEGMRWQGGFWQTGWADREATKGSLKADFMLKMGAQVGAMTRQNDPMWQLSGFNASVMGFYGPLGALGQHAIDRHAAAAAWEGPIREARYVNVSSSDERAVEQMLRNSGLDAGTADRLGTAVRAKLRGDPNADHLMRMALVGVQSQGFGNFESILQRLGQAIKSRPPGDDGQLLMLRGVMNAMAVGGTAAFGPIGGMAVQGLLANPLADAIANDRRDWNFGGFPFQPFERPREESATQLRMDFARQLGGLTRLTANPFPIVPFSPLILPWVGRMDDFRLALQDQRSLAVDGFQLSQAARQLGVQPWQVDNVMSRLQGSGLDWQTSQMAREAVQSLLSGSPDAAFKMQMLGQRLAAQGPQALQQMLGSLAQAMPGLGGDPQTGLVLGAMTRVLAGAAASAFGRMGGDMVLHNLGLPQAEAAARRHLERMEGAGMLQGMSPQERRRFESDFIARALQPQLGALAAYARLGIDRSPFAPMEAMFPQLGAWMAAALDLPLAQQFRFEARTDMEVLRAQPHQLDQMRNLLLNAGMDWQTAQLAVETMRLDAANDPRAAASMQALAGRLGSEGGLGGFQQMLGRLAGRLDDSSMLAGLAQGIAATLTEAGTRAFGSAGGQAALGALSMPVAIALANRDFQQQVENGPFRMLSPAQREHIRQDLLSGHLERLQHGLGGVAGSTLVETDPSHPLHGVDPKSTDPMDYLKSVLLAMMQRERTQDELDRVLRQLQDGDSAVVQLLMGQGKGQSIEGIGGLMMDQRFSMI